MQDSICGLLKVDSLGIRPYQVFCSSHVPFVPIVDDLLSYWCLCECYNKYGPIHLASPCWVSVISKVNISPALDGNGDYFHQHYAMRAYISLHSCEK